MQLVVPHALGSFLPAFLVLLPLPWQIKSRNIATISFITWLFIVNLLYGVNAVVWNGSVKNPAPVYCDIMTKVIFGASIALPASILCVAVHLESVASRRRIIATDRATRQRLVFEVLMCFAIPLLFMFLHYIVQDHRFDIVEDYGCQVVTYESIPAVFIVWLPPLFFSLATLILCGLALRHYIKDRISFAAHLKNVDPLLDLGHWFRLMALAVVEMAWSTILNILAIDANAAAGLRPYNSWSDVHRNFSRVEIVRLSILPQTFLRRFELFWWAMPVSACLFFLIFGFGDDTYKHYRLGFIWVHSSVLRRQPQKQPPLKSFLINGMQPPPPYPAGPTRSLTMDTVEADMKYDFSLSFSKPETPKTAVLDISTLQPSPSADDKFTLSTLQYLESDTGRVARSLSARHSQASIGSQYSQYSFAVGTDTDVYNSLSAAYLHRPLHRTNTSTGSYGIATPFSIPSAMTSGSAFVADPRFVPRSISPIIEADDGFIPLQRVASSQPSMTTVDDADHELHAIPVMVIQPQCHSPYGAYAV